jgi:predicted transcriptional regulator
MRIQLDDRYQEWLRARVAAGEYATIEQAVAAAIQRMMLDDGADDDDASARPLVEEGLSQLDRGESYSHEDVFAHIEGVIASRR